MAPLDDLAGFDALVVSPGVPLNTHPIAEVARAAGVPIIGDIELFAQARAGLPPHKVVGITGTNGKSTTTALVHHILRTAGVPALMGGNIGLPILAAEPLPAGGVYVLELSSYQLDLTQTLDCDVAVLLNITPDHLDRYGSFEAYAASKARLFEMQSTSHMSITTSAEQSAKIYNDVLRYKPGQTLWADTDMLEFLGVSVFDGEAAIFGDQIGLQRDWPSLQGPHNAENAAAAIAVVHSLETESQIITEGLRTFSGLPHRMQRVGEHGGVAFVDDSKATNPESAAPALAAFARVHWIVGGRAKRGDLDPCLPHIGNVVAAYTIGEAGPAFANLLADKVRMVEHSVTLDVAVKSASHLALPGDTVLLSPAAASFDQFRDFEARGEAFRALVEALA
ncbi:UDP-N-acetylmuramoyl-L-alanine--D-glutamate ligase [Sphingomonas bacterium]|uniref:UDP-N-acetylmuramoyl-L-alanine--D-glutamate ligase n=1 Tax=Sphingomonas bacterium TaxID=1895847 RepID=UPI0020C6610E|nr:UDP-N-acetylmuramoyl-L-alanine--D-glutamate ligase [Sphingomonas bacterium]